MKKDNSETIVKMFREEYPFAYFDDTVVKVESLKGQVDLQIWPNVSPFLLGIYSGNAVSRRMLRENLGSEWKSAIDYDSNGVVLRMPCDDIRQLPAAYEHMRECVMALLGDSRTASEIRDSFLLWALDQQEAYRLSNEDNAWKRELDAANHLISRKRTDRTGVGEIKEFDILEIGRYFDRNSVKVEKMNCNAYELLADNVAVKTFMPDLSDELDATSDIAKVRGAAIERAYWKLLTEFASLGKNCGFNDCRSIELRARLNELRKTDDLTRTLARSQRGVGFGKRFENYVVMGLWNRVYGKYQNKAPRFVTQQHVSRHGAHTNAYIDLYLPEIRLAVECDESYHLGNLNADSLREQDIIDSGLVDGLPMHVDASLSLDSIEKQLDEIFKEIEKRVEDPKYKVAGLMAAAEHVRSQGVMRASDELLFGSRSEAIEALNIRQWKNGPFRSRIPSKGFYYDRRTWHVRFVPCSKGKDTASWVELASIELNSKEMKNIRSKDNVVVFVGLPEDMGYMFAGVYRQESGAAFKRVETECPMFATFGM